MSSFQDLGVFRSKTTLPWGPKKLRAWGVEQDRSLSFNSTQHSCNSLQVSGSRVINLENTTSSFLYVLLLIYALYTKRIEYILEWNLDNPSLWICSVPFILKGSSKCTNHVNVHKLYAVEYIDTVCSHFNFEFFKAVK